LPVKCNNWRAAPVTGSALTSLCYLLTLALDINGNMAFPTFRTFRCCFAHTVLVVQSYFHSYMSQSHLLTLVINYKTNISNIVQ